MSSRNCRGRSRQTSEETIHLARLLAHEVAPTHRLVRNVREPERKVIIDAYAEGQLTALRIGLVVTAAIVVVALSLVRRLPDASFDQISAVHGDVATG